MVMVSEVFLSLSLFSFPSDFAIEASCGWYSSSGTIFPYG